MTTLEERYAQFLRDKSRVPSNSFSSRGVEIHGRALDLLGEATTKLANVKRELAAAVGSWGDGPCPSFSCIEAERLHEMLRLLDCSDEFIDRFMISHAATDSSYDMHSVLTDAEGHVTGWSYVEPF